MIEGLVDNRNLALLQELEKSYAIKVELVNDTREYSCYSRSNNSTIYVPTSDICVDSFTHELLHIYLRSKKIFIGASLNWRIESSKNLSKIYSKDLLDHIGNCLDHIKMLPIYLESGCERSKFLFDYDTNKCTIQEVEKIRRNWKQGLLYNSKTIDFYLGKYFGAKACPNLGFDYENSLKELSRIDKTLFSINEKLTNRWLQMNIEPQNSDSQDIEDDYTTIIRDYVDEMEDWAESKVIR